MAMSYFDLLEWLSAPTEKEKAEVWLRANPMPVKPFQMFYGKPYKPQIIIHFLEPFLWCAIALQRHGWQQTRYPLEPDIKTFWASPLGQFYLLWFGFLNFFCLLDRRLDVLEWRFDFEKRSFFKRYFVDHR